MMLKNKFDDFQQNLSDLKNILRYPAFFTVCHAGDVPVKNKKAWTGGSVSGAWTVFHMERDMPMIIFLHISPCRNSHQ